MDEYTCELQTITVTTKGLATCINVLGTPRDLDVVIYDLQQLLTLSVQVAAVCRSGYYQLWHNGSYDWLPVSGSEAGGLQDGHFHLQFTVRHRSGLSGR